MLSGPVRTRDRTAKKHGYDYRIDRCSLISHYIHRSTVPRFGHQSGYSSPKCVPFMLSLSLSLSCSHFLSHSHSSTHAYTLSGSHTLSLSPHLFSVSWFMVYTHYRVEPQDLGMSQIFLRAFKHSKEWHFKIKNELQGAAVQFISTDSVLRWQCLQCLR